MISETDRSVAPVAINEEADPRVFPTWEARQNPGQAAELYWPSPNFLANETMWDLYRATCPPDSPLRKAAPGSWYSLKHVPKVNFQAGFTNFGHNDICYGDTAKGNLHSHFFRDQRAVNAFFPLFSTSTMEGAAGESSSFPGERSRIELFRRHTLSQSLVLAVLQIHLLRPDP